MAYAFRKRGRGRGKVYVSFLNVDGKRVQRLSPYDTIEAAERWAREKEDASSRLRQAPIADRPKTLGALVEWWVKDYASKYAWSTKSVGIAKHVLDHPIASLPLDEVTPGPLEGFLQAKLDEVSPAMVNKIRRMLITVFNKAELRELWSGTNPAKKTERREEPRRSASKHYLRADEVEPVMAQLDPRFRPLFACAVLLGLRRGELAALRKSDVNLERRELLVGRSWERDTTKGGHEDVLPIPEALVPFLKEAIESSPSELVFPNSKGTMMSTSVKLQHVLRRALARAGVVTGYVHRCRGRKGAPCKHVEPASDAENRRCPTHGILLWPKPQVRPVRWHDLRATTASLLARVGTPIEEARRILRHSDPRVTATVYTHVEQEQLRAAVNRMPIRVEHLASRSSRAACGQDVDSSGEVAKSGVPKASNLASFQRLRQDSNLLPPASKAGALSR